MLFPFFHSLTPSLSLPFPPLTPLPVTPAFSSPPPFQSEQLSAILLGLWCLPVCVCEGWGRVWFGDLAAPLISKA